MWTVKRENEEEEDVLKRWELWEKWREEKRESFFVGIKTGVVACPIEKRKRQFYFYFFSNIKLGRNKQ